MGQLLLAGLGAAMLLAAGIARADLVMDTDDNAAVLAGTWNTSNATLLWYGDNYEVAQGGGTADTATFRSPTLIDHSGPWCIYARWTAFPNRFNDARFQVFDGIIGAGGTSLVGTFNVDMRANGGAWRRLGCAQLRSGFVSEVQLSDFGAVAGQFVVADGVRWVADSVDTTEITNEPGEETAVQGSRLIGGPAPIGICNPLLGSRVLTDLSCVFVSAPSSGRVLVRASGQVAFTEAARYVIIGIDDAFGGSTLDSNEWQAEAPGDLTSDFRNRVSFAVQHSYVVTAGTRTFCLKACREVIFVPPPAAGTIFFDELHAEFFATGY